MKNWMCDEMVLMADKPQEEEEEEEKNMFFKFS
jgi:hypothetical protein